MFIGSYRELQDKKKAGHGTWRWQRRWLWWSI